MDKNWSILVIIDDGSGVARDYYDGLLNGQHVSSLWVICPTVLG